MTDTKQQISEELKKQIADDLRNFITTMAGGSANKASKMLKNVSNGYISIILNEKWDAISDDTWRNLQKQVGSTNEWKIVQTRGFKFLNMLFTDARLHSNTFGIIGNTGYGKTQTTEHIGNDNVFVVKSNEYFTSRTFLEELLRLMGKSGYGTTSASMMEVIIHTLLRLESPLIIIDEADKLNDKVLYFFISLYNALEGKCGLIIMATPYLKKRIDDGVHKSKKGYQEIYSRIGRHFLEVPKPSKNDIFAIIEANGITDELTKTGIYNKSECDLRSVKRLVHASLKQAEV